MGSQELLRRMIGMMLIALPLVGCASPASNPTPVLPIATPTAVPPTATPSLIPPTITSTPDYIKVISLDDILGTWYNPNKKLYLRFYEDGILHHSHLLDVLDADPFAKTETWFEGGQLYMKTKEVHGVPDCGDAIGVYEVRLYPKGNIQIVKIEDSCSPRSGDTALPYNPVR